ncbi:jg19859 [Pararge aegeria aegeria]|uniref:Jg19859 protein n=1 Tax=Pararge aegeria aegeria TaxID=348720 RepID=A0A8S4QEB8_9NEOP|nr:jg19859 [Pararge aegeria aegeria]
MTDKPLKICAWLEEPDSEGDLIDPEDTNQNRVDYVDSDCSVTFTAPTKLTLNNLPMKSKMTVYTNQESFNKSLLQCPTFK